MANPQSYPLSKTCTKCGEDKPLDDYPPAKRGKYGRRASCRVCERKRHKKYNQSEAGKTRTRKYSKSEKGKAAAIRAQKSPAGRAAQARYRKTEKARIKWRRNNKTAAGKARHKRYAKRHPEKRQAKHAVNNAIAAGKLPPVSTDYCTRCGAQAEHYHHWSYEPQYWLDVIPVCQSCHVTIHQRMQS